MMTRYLFARRISAKERESVFLFLQTLTENASETRALNQIRLDGEKTRLIDAILAKFEVVTASSIVNSLGELQGGMVRPGFEQRFINHNKISKTMWGTWFSILLSVAEKMDEFGQTVEYLTIGRAQYKTVLIPILPEKSIVTITVDPLVNSGAIASKVRAFVEEFVKASH